MAKRKFKKIYTPEEKRKYAQDWRHGYENTELSFRQVQSFYDPSYWLRHKHRMTKEDYQRFVNFNKLIHPAQMFGIKAKLDLLGKNSLIFEIEGYK